MQQSLYGKKMSANNKGAPPEFLSTHPASENRIADLKALAPKVRPLYEAAKAGK
jgi:predicted Zn-dependent protease